MLSNAFANCAINFNSKSDKTTEKREKERAKLLLILSLNNALLNPNPNSVTIANCVILSSFSRTVNYFVGRSEIYSSENAIGKAKKPQKH
jgi:hypothetical protein